MSRRIPDEPAPQLWRHSVKVTTLWALTLIFLFVAVVLTRSADRVESLLLEPRFLGLSSAQLLTGANLAMMIYLLFDLRKAWGLRGPLRRGHVAGVILAIALTCALQVGVEVVSSVARRLAGAA